MKLLWQQISNTTITEILCSTKHDGVVLDKEHGCFSDETLVDCIRIITLYGKKAFVRLKDADNKYIGLCLDSGCDGLIFANVNNMNYVNSIINAMNKYRSFGLVRNNLWGEGSLYAIQPILIAQIESPDFKLNDIFNYYMIGMYDLSRQCGAIGCFDDKEFMRCIRRINRAIPNLKKRGIHLVKDIEKNYNIYKDWGVIAFSLDTLALIDRVKELNKYA